MAQVDPQRARPRGRRRPGNGRLLAAALMILVGAFLPWLATGAGNVSGVRGAGLWTMYAAVLGLAGALVRSPRLAALHAAVLAVVAVLLPLWQVVHLAGLVGFSGWIPGPGLVMTVGGGVLAGSAALTLHRASQGGPAAG
jgi:pheromone shutdown protein TraB